MSGEIGGIVMLMLERKMVRRFQEAGAVSRSTTKSLDEIGAAEDSSFKRFQRRGVIVEDSSGKWFLDERAWVDLRRRRLITVAAIVLVGGVAAAIFYFVYR